MSPYSRGVGGGSRSERDKHSKRDVLFNSARRPASKQQGAERESASGIAAQTLATTTTTQLCCRDNRSMSVNPSAGSKCAAAVVGSALAAGALFVCRLGEETKNGTSTPGTTRLYDQGSCAGGQLGQPRLSEASTHLAVKGIKNLGNTCFLNAVLQSLGSFPVFRKYLEQHLKVSSLSWLGRSR